MHGFTGTPREIRDLGRYLAEQGHTALGVRLPGHGTTPQAMARTRWQDWLAAVEDGWHLLHAQSRRVFVVGLSMGGALSLLCASRYPVAGVVAMSTPYELPVTGLHNYIFSQILKPLSLFMPYQKKGVSQWFNPNVVDSRVTYPVNPLRSIHELKLMLAETRAALPKVTTPTLLIHSRDDLYVPLHNLDNYFDAIGSLDKQKIVIEQARHVVTRDGDTQALFGHVSTFIDRVKKLEPGTD